ncbi:MAG TPA: diguanylate cyclase, partial [Allocoleopsis sp.]
MLRTLTQRIRQSLDLQQTLNAAVTEVQRFLNADRVVIYRVNPDGTGSVIVESVVPEQAPILDQPLPEEIFPLECHALYLKGRTRTVIDIEQDEMSPCLADTLRELGVRSKLVVPILLYATFTSDAQDSLWGLLIAHQCVPRRWQESEVDLLEKLANQLGIAIYQANLYAQLQIELVERQKAEQAMTKAIEQEQQLRERERFISTVSRNIRQFLDLNYILNTTVDEVLQFLRADRVIVYQFNPDWSGKIVAESVSTPSFSIIKQSIQDSCFVESSIVQAYREGRIQTVDNILDSNLHPCYVGLLNQFQVKAIISIPIIVKQELWGLLIAHDCTGSRQWQNIGWSLLRQLSTQMAIGIQQAELYQQLQSANRDLHRYATTDSLTQVANRRAFEDHLQKEWQRLAREQQPLSLILCDVDYFKRYNDTYGHPAGDICLVQVAQTLQSTLKRPADLVARYGGEEFIIILPNTTNAGAVQVAQNIQQQIAQLQLPHAASLASSYVTLSLG